MTQFHSNITFAEAGVRTTPVDTSRRPVPMLLVVTRYSTYAIAYDEYFSDSLPRVTCLSGTYAGRIAGVEVARLGTALQTGYVVTYTESLRVHAMRAEITSLDLASESSSRSLVGYRLHLSDSEGRLIVETSPVRAVCWVLA